MKTLRTLFHPLLAGIVLLTGCLTIEEHYTFKKDGSGSMEFVIDMSELKTMMEALDDGKGGKGGPDLDGGSMEMKDELDGLKAVPGISKVKHSNKDWVQKVSFRFKDIDALNGALNVLMPDSSGVQQRFFHWEGSTLVRTNNRHASE